MFDLPLFNAKTKLVSTLVSRTAMAPELGASWNADYQTMPWTDFADWDLEPYRLDAQKSSNSQSPCPNHIPRTTLNLECLSRYLLRQRLEFSKRRTVLCSSHFSSCSSIFNNALKGKKKIKTWHKQLLIARGHKGLPKRSLAGTFLWVWPESQNMNIG